MDFVTTASEAAETGPAMAEILQDLAMGGCDPAFVCVAYTEHHAPEALRAGLAAALPGVPILGSSSCRGVLTDKGLFGFGKPVLAMAAVMDADAACGTVSVAAGDGLADRIAVAIRAAQARAGRPGEVPDFVWMHASPGLEETAIAAIQANLGDAVVIAGGSSADETIGGKWSHFSENACHSNGVGLALIFTDHPVTHYFQSGYVPSEHSGRATRSAGRCLAEIDGLPAAEVYNRWADGLIDAALRDRTQSILGASSWFPIGKPVGRIGGVENYCLVHPDSVGAGGELNLFAEVEEGTRLTLMRSGPEELMSRAAMVARTSMDRTPQGLAPAGGMMVFCAGCMLALEGDITRAAAAIRDAYGDLPFLCVFTFGEQGSFATGQCQHGNLMISSSLINRAAAG